MKLWDEARMEMVVYIKDSLDMYEDDVVVGKTKPYQKAYIGQCYSDEIMVVISSGEFEGYDLYWHTKTDKPEELLTKEEYSLLNMSEKKIWIDLQKYIVKIDSLKDKSEDILALRELIVKSITD